jgi:hypothetical protein
MTDKAYKVYLTPLTAEMTYGTEVEISDYVIASSIGNIRKNTDSDDHVIGEYLLGSVDLTCANFNGEFNEADPRSFFKYKRDRSKIRVEYFSSLTDSTISFKGLITDEGTSSDDDTAKLKVLALESILRTVQVSSGAITAGDYFSDAIKAILNKPAITAVLTYSAANISVDFDLTIDDEGPFANISTWDALKQLLIASNSVVYVDNETIMVVPRDYDSGNISYFYGPGDQLDRENIIDISSYNNGKHRMFNSVTVNGTNYTDDNSRDWFGLSDISFTFDFITDSGKETQISRNLVNQFRYPRIEFEITVTTDLANELGFFDTTGVAHPMRLKPCCNYDASLWGVALYNTSSDVYNINFGGVIIPGRLAFKMIQRTENPKDFTTRIKLRNRGKTFDDGVLIYWAAIWGLSRWGISTY